MRTEEAELRRAQIIECIRLLDYYYVRSDYASVSYACDTIKLLAEIDERESEQEQIQDERQRERQLDRMAAEVRGFAAREGYSPNAF